jgi:hypothetical protein
MISTWSGIGLLLVVIGILVILFTALQTAGWILFVLGIVGIVFGFVDIGGRRSR